MEDFINQNLFLINQGGDDMSKVLIATLYSPDPVLLASNRVGADRLVLILNKDADKKQEESLKLIKESIGRVVDIKIVKISVYDIPAIAKKCVEVIDMQPKEDRIFTNVTSGRKTMALGLLFASYARCNRVERIAYNPEEDKSSVVYLPKMSFKLNESQRKILEYLEEKNSNKKSYADIAEEIGMSRAMLYKTLDELKDLDFVKTEDCLEITDAGRIARL
jgi:CRISPR-associated protein Csa3